MKEYIADKLYQCKRCKEPVIIHYDSTFNQTVAINWEPKSVTPRGSVYDPLNYHDCQPGAVGNKKPRLVQDSLKTEMEELVDLRLQLLVREATGIFGEEVKMPSVRLDLYGTTAGMAIPLKWHLRINPVLMRDNVDDFLDNTIPHELSHLIAHQLYGDKIRPHGREWRSVMRALGCEPSTYHSMDVLMSYLHKYGEAYLYRCDCSEHPLKPMQHEEIIKGRAMSCKACNSDLVFEERVDRNDRIEF